MRRRKARQMNFPGKKTQNLLENYGIRKFNTKNLALLKSQEHKGRKSPEL